LKNLRHLTLIIVLLFNSLLSQDSTKYQWPLAPFNSSKLITGTFCEYRSTSASGHYHNGVDIPAPAGTPVYAVLPGTVTALSTADPTGYDNYIRVRSVINGNNKDITYYHTNPVKSIGQTVQAGEIVSTIAIDHVHLTEYYLGNTSLEVNPLRPDGGLFPLVDIWKPRIVSVRFFVDGTSTQLSPSYLGGKVDIITKIQEANGEGSTAVTNNGTYIIGYKVFSSDTQQVVYNPPSNSVRYLYYIKPLNSYVNNNYYQPEATSSNHVYIVTNGDGADYIRSTRIVNNNFWNTDLLPDGNYVVMIYTFDTRGNGDTVFIKVTKTNIDLIPPSQTNFLSIISNANNNITLNWEANPTPDLKGHRLYYSLNNSSWILKDNENILNDSITSRTYDNTLNREIFFKLYPVDKSPNANVGPQSDVYGIRINVGPPKVLIVDGFTRTSGSYKQAYHDFVFYYATSFRSDFHTSSSKAVENGLVNLNDYNLVIWFVGDESVTDESLNSNEQEIIKNYLRNGGKLFITGSEIGYDLFENGSLLDRDFYNNYLKAKYNSDNAASFSAMGEQGSIFQGIEFGFGLTSQGAPYNEDNPDEIDTLNNSKVLLRYSNNKVACIGYHGYVPGGIRPCSLVYLAFPFEVIHGSAKRQALMERIFQFLGLSTKVDDSFIPSEFKVFQNQPNPFNANTKILFQIPERDFVSIDLYDILGRFIKNIEAKEFDTGLHEIHFSSINISSGIYVINVKWRELSKSIKAVIIK